MMVNGVSRWEHDAIMAVAGMYLSVPEVCGKMIGAMA